jgi:hypothetical protein
LDARRKGEPEFKKLQAKGIPPYLSDFSFIHLIIQDRILFTRDFTQYSVIPLDGYMKWSEILESDFKGFSVDFKGAKLVNDNLPRLNYLTLQKIFLLPADSDCEEIRHFEKTVDENGPVFFDESVKVP